MELDDFFNAMLKYFTESKFFRSIKVNYTFKM
jgi:hypothetical protein